MQSIVTLTMNPSIDKSASVDHVIPERKLRCASPRHEPGGGGVNVSRAIHRLGGHSVAFFTAGGSPGEMLRQLLNDEGLAQHPIPIEGRTRENLIVYEESTGLQFRFGMPGAHIKESEWMRCLSKLQGGNSSRPGYIVASGSLPPGAPDDFYARVAALAKESGSKIIVDASGEPLRRALDEGVFLIKPNLREFRELVGSEIESESQQERLARGMVDAGQSEVVVISHGAGGSLVVSKDGCERLRAPTVVIKSKVGAGDSMVAGIVLSLARGKPLADAVRFGIAAGAAAVMTPGTELCRRDDTESIYEQLT